LEESENKNISRKTKIDITLFKSFLCPKNVKEPEESVTPQKLDAQLKEFILGVENKMEQTMNHLLFFMCFCIDS
jgi:hypothetical protein